MESSEENIIENCRICDVSVTEGDFVPLFTISCHIIERTYSGELFDELIQLPCTEDINYPYICNGCDLQMKLFKRLKDKAWKRLTTKVDTNEITIQESDTEKYSQNAEAEDDDSSLVTNDVECEVKNENSGSHNNLVTYFESTTNEILSNDSEQTENIEKNNFLIVYNVKGQSLQSVNIDDLIELENCEKENSNCDENIDENFIIETTRCEEEKTGSPQEAVAEAVIEEAQNLANYHDINSNNKSTENRSKSTETECKECGLIFPSMRCFRVHRQERHGRTHLCKICHKLFKTAENLEGHMRQHSGLPPYQCEICNKTFNQKVHYQYHIKRHKNERDFTCNLCDKSYFNKSDLTMHIKRSHEGEKNFFCSFQNCGKRFYFEQHLKYHSYVHSGQRNFQCDLCRQRFVAPNALALHKRTLHSTGIRFACSQCGKTFRRKHHLEAHSSVHEDKAESSNSTENYVLNRKAKILKSNSQLKFTSLNNTPSEVVNEIDEITLQTMNDQSDDNDFLMDVIESCSETDNQNETDNFEYC